MRIGALNKRVTLQAPTRTSDGAGGYTVAWSDDEQVWAAIWPVSATEQIAALQTALMVSHRVRIRYRSDLTSDWRIKYGARYFAILSIINPNEQNAMLELLCKETAA